MSTSQRQQRADPALPLDRLRVLVVDDGEDFLEYLRALLGILGHEVATATGAEEALATARAFKPHLALVDLSLPGMEGSDLARRLRNVPELGDTVLVAVSGYALGDRRRDSSVFDDHLVKPVEPEHLEDLIHRRRQNAESRR